MNVLFGIVLILFALMTFADKQHQKPYLVGFGMCAVAMILYNALFMVLK